MSSGSVGGAPRGLVGGMRALRKNREALRSELRNCQPEIAGSGAEPEEAKAARKRDSLEGKGLGKETAGKKETARHTRTESKDGGNEDGERL